MWPPSGARIAFLGVLAPALAAAQQVQGRVLDAGDMSPVAGATVTLADSTGGVIRQVVAGADGRFWLWYDRAGAYLLGAERIGYATVEGQPVRLDSTGVVEVELRMRPEAVPLEPLRVVARRDVKRFTPDEFYDRMSRLGDRGYFMTREEIERTGARLPSLALQWVPGTWVRPAQLGEANTIALMSYGRICRPAIYLNGRPLPEWADLDDWVMVGRIEGIEVYRGHFIPRHYYHTDFSWGCGFVLVWTRTDYDPRFAFTWERTIMFGALGGLLLGVWSLF